MVTDRLSAFDVIMPNGIPDKGVVFNQISLYWFKQVEGIIPNHVVSTDISTLPEPFQKAQDQLRPPFHDREKSPAPAGRMHRAWLPDRVGLEGIPENRKGLRNRTSQRLSGVLPNCRTHLHTLHQGRAGPRPQYFLRGNEKNPEERFALAEKVKEASLAIYKKGRDLADAKGIIIADTKFEFGLLDGKLILIDEVMTPDSSRFWPKGGLSGKGSPRKAMTSNSSGITWKP